MRDGRWAVARVVEARRTKTGGVLALVEWKGGDPVSGVAWENSWFSLRDLSVAARPEAKALLPRHARRACWEEVAAGGAAEGAVVDRRRSSRLEAERVARAAPGVCYRALLVEAYTRRSEAARRNRRRASRWRARDLCFDGCPVRTRLRWTGWRSLPG